MQTSKRRIPTWDGNLKQWRRYAKEIAWHVQGTNLREALFGFPVSFRADRVCEIAGFVVAR